MDFQNLFIKITEIISKLKVNPIECIIDIFQKHIQLIPGDLLFLLNLNMVNLIAYSTLFHF